MPPQYVIRLNAKISWEGRENGLPEYLYAYIMYDGDQAAAINDIIEKQAGAFIRMQAFACQKDQGSVIDLAQCPAERRLVPFKWIVDITSDVHKMVGGLPHPDEFGVERLTNGEEPKFVALIQPVES